MQTVFSRYI